jgi:hypothetical protein
MIGATLESANDRHVLHGNLCPEVIRYIARLLWSPCALLGRRLKSLKPDRYRPEKHYMRGAGPKNSDKGDLGH